MKTLLLILCILVTLCTYSQEYDAWHKRDTTKKSVSLNDSLRGKSEMKIRPSKPATPSQQYPIVILKDSDRDSDTLELKSLKEMVTFGKNGFKVSPFRNKLPPRSRFKGHWSGIYYGFINTAGVDYSMYPEGTPEFMDLDWGSSFALQFNFIKHSIGLSKRNNFGLVVGLGFDYQRMRFANKDQSITMQNGQVTPLSLSSLDISGIRRSTFKTLYLTIPLLMEVQFPAKSRNSLYVSGGVVGGIRMHSKTKVVYDDRGKHKRKEKDSFNMIPFKADVTGRIGYRSMAVWGSYTLTQIFKGNRGPELHPYTIGIGLTI